jgi:hypothetical protein
MYQEHAMRFSVAIQAVPAYQPQVDCPSGGVQTSAQSVPYEESTMAMTLEELADLDQRVRQSGEW